MKSLIFKQLAILLLGMISVPVISVAQSIGITDGASFTPDNSAVLELKSTSRGLLVPRVTTVQRTTGMSATSNGLLVYDTDTKTFWYHNGTSWIELVNSSVIRLAANGEIQIGDGTNQFVVESDGSTRFDGTATVWDDLTVMATAAKNGSQSPDWEIARNNTYLWFFKLSGTDELLFTVQMPHSWKEGSAIKPHVHWITRNDMGATNVVWGLEYTWSNVAADFGATTTISTSTVTVGAKTAYNHRISSFPSIDATGKTLSSILMCRLFRDGDNATDTYGDKAGVLQIDFHYEKDREGSRTDFTK